MSAPTLRCEAQALDRQAARDLTDQIKTDDEALSDLIIQAYTQRAWAALDYPSWDAYVHEEFRGLKLRVPQETRSGLVASLRDSGLSLRAIASATGSSVNTIRKDLDQVCHVDTPEPPAEEPADPELPQPAPSRITGRDGRTYPPRPNPNRSKREPTQAEKQRELRGQMEKRLQQLEDKLRITENYVLNDRELLCAAYRDSGVTRTSVVARLKKLRGQLDVLVDALDATGRGEQR